MHSLKLLIILYFFLYPFSPTHAKTSFIVVGHLYPVIHDKILMERLFNKFDSLNPDYIFILGDSLLHKKQIYSYFYNRFKGKIYFSPGNNEVINGSLSKYKEISENIIGSLRYRASMINGIDGDVRLTNRLYMGAKEVRGFVTGKMGPKDGKDWVGGNYKSSFSADVQLPNLLPESYNTDFNLFLDAGNVWGVDYGDNVLNDSSKIRSSIGLGANVFTPVGPLSFIFSKTLLKKDTDQTESFTFNLGTSF